MQLAQVEREIAALLERLPEADGVLSATSSSESEELDGKKRELTERISASLREEERHGNRRPFRPGQRMLD